MFDPMIGPLNFLSVAVPTLIISGILHLIDKKFEIFSKLVDLFEAYSYEEDEDNE